MIAMRSWVLPAATFWFFLASAAASAEGVAPYTKSPAVLFAQADVEPPAVTEPELLPVPALEPVVELDPVALAEKAVDDARASLRNEMATGGDVRGARRHLQAMIKELDKVRKEDKRQAKKKKKKKKKQDREVAETAEASPVETLPAELPKLELPTIVLPETASPQLVTPATPTTPPAELPTLALPGPTPAVPPLAELPKLEQPTIVLPETALPQPLAPAPPTTPPAELPTLALPVPIPAVPPLAEATPPDQPPALAVPGLPQADLPVLAMPEQPTIELPSETPVIEPPAPVETETARAKDEPGLFKRLFGSGSGKPPEVEEQAEPVARIPKETAKIEEPALPIFTELPPIEGAEVITVTPGESEVIEDKGRRRVVVREGGQVIIKHDDNDRFRRKGEDITVEEGKNGRTVTTVTRRNGSQIVTIRSASGDILQRYRKRKNGKVEVLIGERDLDGRPRRGERSSPPKPDKRFDFTLALPKLNIPIPQQQYIIGSRGATRSRIEEALIAPPVEAIERPYSLVEIRRSQRLRAKLRRIDVDTVNFNFGAATIAEDQVPNLQTIGNALASIIAANPNEVFMIEGHTDAVGSNVANLALSDRRAESIAGILTFYFNIPPENLITQGYGEQYLKLLTAAPERANRRASVRRITPLLVGRF